MSELRMGAIESRFADIIWQNEPVTSPELVKLAAKELDWKKSTTWKESTFFFRYIMNTW